MPRSTNCIVHTHDYVTAHEYHHLRPVSRGGWTASSNMVWLCANGHGDVHFFLDAIEDAADRLRKSGTAAIADTAPVGAVPWDFAKHFSPAIRETAARGWRMYATEYLTGAYDRHAKLWSTSGLPRDGMPAGMPSYSSATSRSEVSLLLRIAEVTPDPASAVKRLLTAGTPS